MQIATFAAGCFWGVEAEFRQQPGVLGTRVGYSGGHTQDPNYRDVCRGKTGHAEAVEVTFDPRQISFEQLLMVFWRAHDPTQVNRQGPDIGSQYRSAVFYQDEEQEREALASREELQRHLSRPIATEVSRATEFWPAEEYHQQYLEKRGLASCHNAPRN